MKWNLDNIDGIIFDMDGVIFDTEALSMKIWHILGEKYNLDNIEEVAMQCIGRSLTDTMHIMEVSYGHLISVKDVYGESRLVFQELIQKEGIPIKTGARELLSYLKEREIKVGLASSTSYDTVIKQLTCAGLIDYFQVIVGGDMLEHSKPKPDIYLMACDKLGVSPQKTVAVEDSLNGIKSAHSAGMISVMVPDLIKPTDEILTMTNDVMDSLNDVLEYIKTKL
ncbi:MAG: HAD family hydrolase [Hominimerdicola sp.]